MLDPRQLQHKHRLMPGVQTVNYFVALGGGTFGGSVAVSGAERRPQNSTQRAPA